MTRLMLVLCCALAPLPSLAAKERQVEVTYQVRLNAPEGAKSVKLWIPAPVSEGGQTVVGADFRGNASKAGFHKESENGSTALFASWEGPSAGRELVYSFRVKRNEVVAKDFPKNEAPLDRKKFDKYLRATSRGPVTGKVKETAERITAGESSVLGKSRAIYDWILANMHRDPEVKGCGLGEVERLLEALGGKCGDIHSVYVALARSVGVPSREIFGIRIPKGRAGDMTSSQHCWAEFFLPGYGWVPVDPSDVRKHMLENKISDLSKVSQIVDYYFGAVDENRIAFGEGRDLVLNPPQNDGKLNYFMYPYAEADGKALDDLFGFKLGYSISFKEQ
jgi:transglutaminase-like putative cysteine protease